VPIEIGTEIFRYPAEPFQSVSRGSYTGLALSSSAVRTAQLLCMASGEDRKTTIAFATSMKAAIR
jgi:hypothetical protein